MPEKKSPFYLGQRVALSYQYVEPSRLLGEVVRVSPGSVLIHIDGECHASRFFLRDGRWRSEFGRQVSIKTAPLEHQPIKHSLI